MSRAPGYLRVGVALALLMAATPLRAALSITRHGITWTFERDVVTGQFATGDDWVVGPVTVVAISTDLHAAGFTPRPDDDGSMVNPGATGSQGYDGSLASYRAELNAGRPNGRPLSRDNPLVLKPHSSLISMVSWLYTSAQNSEPGTPAFNGGTKAPRPVTRSGAILTVLPEPAPAGSFRPPYCGDDKTIRFNVRDLDTSRLKSLDPVTPLPPFSAHVKRMSRPWIDHVHEFMGAMIHPSMNMPNYGREMGRILAEMILFANLDLTKVADGPTKEAAVLPLVQFGIDCTGIADAGGGWPANGGHGMGRKLPILLAGVLLNDAHMLKVGEWETRFQEDEQTFYVTQKDVDRTHSDAWNPDPRARTKQPYEVEDIGMPEWGIRHFLKPEADNRGWETNYRDVNGAVLPGFALAVAVMELRREWNHDAYLDYAARYMQERRTRGGREKGTNCPTPFMRAMWDAYSDPFGLSAAPKSSSGVPPAPR